jgi:hypothetical protein
LTLEVAAGGLGRGGVDVPVPEHATISSSDAAVGTMVARRAQFIAQSHISKRMKEDQE